MSNVKITTSGKYSIRISAQLKPFLLALLMKYLHSLNIQVAVYHQLTTLVNETCLLRAVVEELYVKNHTQLSIINREGKLLLTLAQAHALWQMGQELDQEAFMNPEMGQLLLELHQKLS